MVGGWFFEPGWSVSFSFARQAALGVSVFYRRITGTRGTCIIDEYYPEGTKSIGYVDQLGADYSALISALSITVTF
jgi:hypothetical protein